jgi:multidrug resistance efflux pump
MADDKDIELRSEEVQEILGTPPGWLLRWGITIIAAVFALLLMLSYVFKYPDMIRGRVTIISRNPPVTLVARATGKIDHLLVTDQQLVEEGMILAILENPARYGDVFSLHERLDSVRFLLDDPERFAELTFKDELLLGQIHPYYSAFVTQCSEYSTFVMYNVFQARIETLDRQISDQEKYLQQLTNQARILDDKLQLSRRQYNRDSELARQGVIPASELEKSQAEYLGHELNHRTAIATITTTSNQINQMHRQIQELRMEKGEQANRLTAGLREKYDNLINQISAWNITYVIRSPISGKVTFTNIWSQNQQITEGAPLFSVVPEDSSRIIGRVEIPLSGSGKVGPGQRVKIKLDNFPHLEYGMLEGRISSMSLVPAVTSTGAQYTAELELTGGLVTNYGIELAFNQEMAGTAEIITSDRRLIERLIQPLSSLFRDRILTH